VPDMKPVIEAKTTDIESFIAGLRAMAAQASGGAQ